MHNRIILVGKGGSGKDYLRKKLEGRNFVYQISYTTRPPREGEVDGKDYHFITHEKAQEMIQNDEWYEYVYFHNWLYGTSKAQFYASNCPVFIMTPSGIAQIKPEDRKDCFIIFLDPPSDIIMERLKNRNMPGDTAERRFQADVEQFEGFSDFDMRVTDPYF
jgi:guanylate kinase